MMQGPDVNFIHEKLEEVEKRSNVTKDEIKKLNMTITTLSHVLETFEQSGLSEHHVSFKEFLCQRDDMPSAALMLYWNHSWHQIRQRLEEYEQHIRVLNHVLQNYRKERNYLRADESFLQKGELQKTESAMT